MAENKIDLHSLTTNDIPLNTSESPGLSQCARQLIQIERSRNKDRSAYFDKAGFTAEMNQWQYPLHLIDFETTTPALPFSQGMKPFQTVAFQFSHHLLHDNGDVEHRGEFLDSTHSLLINSWLVWSISIVDTINRRFPDNTTSLMCFATAIDGRVAETSINEMTKIR